jgi:hypothetical protein
MKATWTRAAMAACALAALTLACSGEKPAPAASTAPAATAPAATVPPATTAPAAAMTGSTMAAPGAIGVPECDEYVTKYESCIKQHVPDAQKVQLQQGFDAMRTSWKTAATNAESRPGLASVCKQAMDAAKAATSFYGCTW